MKKVEKGLEPRGRRRLEARLVDVLTLLRAATMEERDAERAAAAAAAGGGGGGGERKGEEEGEGGEGGEGATSDLRLLLSKYYPWESTHLLDVSSALKDPRPVEGRGWRAWAKRFKNEHGKGGGEGPAWAACGVRECVNA